MLHKCNAWLLCAPMVFVRVSALPAAEVWQPVKAGKDARHALSNLTKAGVIQVGVNFGQRGTSRPSAGGLEAPPLAVQVAVGTPKQVLTAVLDTTSGTTWFVDLGAQAVQNGAFPGVSLYRYLESITVQNAAKSEVKRRQKKSLGAMAPGQEVIGRVISDNVQVVGDVVPWQPILLVEQVPDAVQKWGAAGVLGLGIGSDITPPLVKTWHTAWILGPAGMASNPIGLMASDPDARHGQVAEAHRLATPVIALWPRPGSGRLYLGVGTLPDTQWAPISQLSSGWTCEGYVSVDDSRRQGVEKPSKKWAARLLVDTTVPCIGVPAIHFADVITALIPVDARPLCWWYEAGAPGIQVQCDCSVVSRTTPLHVQVAGRRFRISAENLFCKTGRICTSLVWPRLETGEIWHLGVPFLRQVAVTLDVPGQQIGFAVPPPNLGEVVEHLQAESQTWKHTLPKTTTWHLSTSWSGVFLVAQLIMLGFLAACAAGSAVHSAIGECRNWAWQRREWRAVSTSPDGPEVEAVIGSPE